MNPNAIFDNVKVKSPKKSQFDLSNENKLTAHFGDLVPVKVLEVMPGDVISQKVQSLIRLNPMYAPIMHRIDVRYHAFFVPNRLIWNEWEDFITGGEDGTSTPTMPHFKVNQLTDDLGRFAAPGSIADYMGMPTINGADDQNYQTEICALPFRAYNLIWNEYFRDQNLQPKIPLFKTSGELVSDELNEIIVRKCNKRKDYFTSALPWPQRGPEASFAMGSDADVTIPNNQNISMGVPGVGDPGYVRGIDGTEVPVNGAVQVTSGVLTGDGDPIALVGRLSSTLEGTADLSTASAVTINALRWAISLQHWLEANALGGSRYVEQILAHYGVKVPDSRLQRPEFLGSVTQPITVSEVLQTSETAASAQGNMAGHGIAGIGSDLFYNREFTEHGYILVLQSIVPRNGYMQGIPRQFLRQSKFDFAFPEFAHLGEQEIKQCEIMASGVKDADNATFGYTSRYAEYKTGLDEVHGDFRTSGQDYWHLASIFPWANASENPVNLDDTFIKADPVLNDWNRIFNVTDMSTRPFYCDVWNDVKAVRPLPVYGTPGLTRV